MKHDPETRRESDRPALRDGFPWKEGHRQESLSGKEKPRRHASPIKRVIVQNRMPLITGIHLSVLFIRQGIANFGVCVRVSILETACEAHQRSGTLFVVVAKTFDRTQAEYRIFPRFFFLEKGDCLHGV